MGAKVEGLRVWKMDGEAWLHGIARHWEGEKIGDKRVASVYFLVPGVEGYIGTICTGYLNLSPSFLRERLGSRSLRLVLDTTFGTPFDLVLFLWRPIILIRKYGNT